MLIGSVGTVFPFTVSQISNRAVTDRDGGFISRDQASRDIELNFAWTTRVSVGGGFLLGFPVFATLPSRFFDGRSSVHICGEVPSVGVTAGEGAA
jgi:hypothetical protein